jgi:large subunit ribosomal protein L24
MTDYTKYVPYLMRAVKHKVKPPGWRTPESNQRTATKFLDVSKEPSLKRPLVDQRKSRSVQVNMISAFNLERGDLVQVLFGRDKGHTGVIRKILPGTNQVIVSGCNVVKSYRPSDAEKQINPTLPPLIPVEAPIHVTNVVPVDPVTKKPTRIKKRYSMTGECVRISKVSGSAMPDPVPVEPSLADRALERKARIKAGYTRGAPLSDRAVWSWKTHKTHYESLARMINVK